jgi:hypothetical protein
MPAADNRDEVEAMVLGATTEAEAEAAIKRANAYLKRHPDDLALRHELEAPVMVITGIQYEQAQRVDVSSLPAAVGPTNGEWSCDCRFILARVSRAPRFAVEDSAGVPRPSRHVKERVRLVAGFQAREGGIFRPTAHARQRVAENKAAKNRRPAGQRPADAVGPDDPFAPDQPYVLQPVAVECPRCGRVSALDPGSRGFARRL